LTAEGIGKVTFKGKDGKDPIIEEVLFVLDMKTNLLSLGQLLEKGVVIRIEDNCLKVFDEDQKLVIKVNLSENRTFRIWMNILEHECLATSKNKMEWLWHHRFGHLNFKDLRLLIKQKMVEGLPQILVPKEMCKECIKCKQAKSSFSKYLPTKATEKLGIIVLYLFH